MATKGRTETMLLWKDRPAGILWNRGALASAMTIRTEALPARNGKRRQTCHPRRNGRALEAPTGPEVNPYLLPASSVTNGRVATRK